MLIDVGVITPIRQLKNNNNLMTNYEIYCYKYYNYNIIYFYKC